MAKKVKLHKAASIMPSEPETRNVAAEQAQAQEVIDRKAANDKKNAEAGAVQEEYGIRLARAEAARQAAEAKARDEAERKRPLTPAERALKERLEKMAMGAGNMEPQNMYLLSMLRERSKLG